MFAGPGAGVETFIGPLGGGGAGVDFGAGVEGGSAAVSDGGAGFIFVTKKENFAPELLGNHSMKL